jgi:tRNA modification GTPase
VLRLLSRVRRARRAACAGRRVHAARVLNGKLDLAQAERSRTDRRRDDDARRAAARSLSGAFSNEIRALSRRLIELRMFVEATLDFPGGRGVSCARPTCAAASTRSPRRLPAVLARAKQGALLREGLRRRARRPPNVGKSSLLEPARSATSVAIVTPSQGTTRDA